MSSNNTNMRLRSPYASNFTMRQLQANGARQAEATIFHGDRVGEVITRGTRGEVKLACGIDRYPTESEILEGARWRSVQGQGQSWNTLVFNDLVFSGAVSAHHRLQEEGLDQPKYFGLKEHLRLGLYD